MASIENQNKWALEKYVVWEHNQWKEENTDKQYCYLILTSSQLLIVYKNVALESLHLLGSEKIKAFYAKASIEVHITYLKTSNRPNRKFRILLANGFRHKSNIENCLEVVKKLDKFICIIQHSKQDRKTLEKYEDKNKPKIDEELFEEGKFQVKNEVDSFFKQDTSIETVMMLMIDPRSRSLVNRCSWFVNNLMK